MKKTLIIAEKPSVARDIAKALNVPYQMENDHFVISHCIGHLVQLNYDAPREAQLPILPTAFNLSVIDQTKDQFKILANLMARDDIECVVNACDAGREGELIFRLVYDKVVCNKPIERMWLQSMTPEAIRSAFHRRKPGAEYESLYDAARSRSEADWLYGINGSRAVKSAVGRVMTPTLAMVVNRYEANKQFKSSTYYEVVGNFRLIAGSYQGRLLADDEVVKFDSKEAAEAKLDSITLSNPCRIEDIVERKKTLPPVLFHLTALQQEANRRYGFSANQTLKITQALYETHKAVTYPRTDANALPSDYLETATEVMTQLAKKYQTAATVVAEQWITSNPRIFNDSKISDHFAIIPTGKLPVDLSADEELIYDLILKRFIAIFYPAAEHDHTERITYVGNERFKTTGKQLVEPGWLFVYGNQEDVDDSEASPSIVAAEDGEAATLIKLELKEGKTKPPALYTEATLLKAMETAGKEIDDEALAESLKGKGIGTPATRASIIEKLKYKGKFGAYVETNKKSLVPTERGLKLIHHLRESAPSLISPELTGEWEYKLNQVEEGSLSRREFMAQIEQAVSELVSSVPSVEPIRSESLAIGQCPVCNQSELVERKFSYMCSDDSCGFKINKAIAGHKMTKADITAILTNGKTKKIDSFISKADKPFSAMLVLDKEGKTLKFEF